MGGGHLKTHESGFNGITIVEPDVQEREDVVGFGFLASDESSHTKNGIYMMKPGPNASASIACVKSAADYLDGAGFDHRGLVFEAGKQNEELDIRRCGIGRFEIPSDPIYMPTETDELRLTFTNGEFVEGVATDGDFNLYLGIGES